MKDEKKSRIYGGYRFIYAPEHPKAHKDTGYVAEHIIVMEKSIGRRVIEKECIHHLDRDKLNNKIENLKLCKDNSEHQKKYHQDKLVQRMAGLKKYHDQRKINKSNGKITDRSYERNYNKTKLQENKLGQYTLTIPRWLVKKVLDAEKGDLIFFDFKGKQLLLEKINTEEN